MKVFAIRDASISKERDLAWMLYYPEVREFHIEISEEVDEWEAPLLLSSFVKRGKRSLDPDASRLWAELRVIPPDRQNLGMILRDNGLEEYDPYRLLTLAGGRCAQDDCFLVSLEESRIPPSLSERLRKTIVSFIPSGSTEYRHRYSADSCAEVDLSVDINSYPEADEAAAACPAVGAEQDKAADLSEAMEEDASAAGDVPESFLLFFRDGMIRRISVCELFSAGLKGRQRERLAGYRERLAHAGLQAGGHGLRIGSSICLSAEELRTKGTALPVTPEDFQAYIQANVIDTSTAAQLLHCTRQNIQDLVKREKLRPVLSIRNTFLFLREDIFLRNCKNID